MSRWEYSGFCSVCLVELPAEREVPWCGRRCRGVHRALEKAAAAGDKRQGERFGAIADELTADVALREGFRDVEHLRNARNNAAHELRKVRAVVDDGR